MKVNSLKSNFPFNFRSVEARSYSEAAIAHMNAMVKKLWAAMGPGVVTLQGNDTVPADLSKKGKVKVCQLWKLKSVVEAAWIPDSQKLGNVLL
jgi:hypothetical protein